MTLIAGFKCQDGYVMCADSQESIKEPDGTEYRRTCQKLVPIQVGSVDVSIAGAGDGNLIEAFVEHLRVKFRNSNIQTIESIPVVIKDETFAFAKNHGISKAKAGSVFRFTIGAYSPASQKLGAWKTAAGDPIEIQTYSLIGFEDSRYDYAARNYYRPGMPISQGISLGLYLMWLGEQTSNSIKAPITVAVLTRAGVQFQDQEKINRIDQKVRLFTAQFERQFLACSDVGLHNEAFARNFKEFGKTIVQFRNEFMAEWVEGAFDKGLDRIVESWTEIPTGTTIVTVPITPEVDRSIREMQERGAAHLRQTVPHLQEKDRVISNLTALRILLQEERDGVSGKEEGPTFGIVLNEVSQAAMMGPLHLNQTEHFMLARVLATLIVPAGEVQNSRLHLASVSLRIAVIDQALAILENAMSSDSQPSEN